MEPAELRARRGLIGVLAICSLCLAGLTFWQMPDRTGAVGAFTRVGVLLFAFWLAVPLLLQHPKIIRFFPWYILVGLVLLVVMIRYVLYLIPAFLVLALLSMFSIKKRDPKSSHKK